MNTKKIPLNLGLIEQPESFFSHIGGLHDADVISLEWDTVRAELIVCIDDLHSNFFQTDEYPGKLSVRLKAVGLTVLKVNIFQGKYPARILHFTVNQISQGETLKAKMQFGEGEIQFDCEAIICEKLN